MTTGIFEFFIKLFARSFVSKTPNFAVGILYFSQMCFVKIFDPSSLADLRLGPKTDIFFFSRKSTIPLTNGFSGPTITKSILFSSIKFWTNPKLFMSTSTFSAISAVPAFPGRQKIFSVFFEL